MKKYFVTIGVQYTIEVEAASQEDAELKAIDSFDAGEYDPEVLDSWTDDENEGILDALIAQQEDREHAAELEDFDPITILEKQEQTGELK